MPEFTKEELNLIYLYDPGNLRGLIYELSAMMSVLMPDENELLDLTQKTIGKLKAMSKADYKALCESWTPDFGLHFDLGLPSEMTGITGKTED